jgi:hypothetical protein
MAAVMTATRRPIPSSNGEPRTRRRWLVYPILAILVIVVAWPWLRHAVPSWTHRTVTFDALSTEGVGEVGRTYYYSGLFGPDSGTSNVTITAVTPIVDKASAPAGVFLFLCGLGSGSFVGVQDLGECVHPASFRAHTESRHGPFVGVAINPLDTGQVRIDGFKVTYRDDGTRSVTVPASITINVSESQVSTKP